MYSCSLSTSIRLGQIGSYFLGNPFRNLQGRLFASQKLKKKRKKMHKMNKIYFVNPQNIFKHNLALNGARNTISSVIIY